MDVHTYICKYILFLQITLDMYLHFQFGHNIFPVVPASSFSDLTLHVLYDVCVCVCVFSPQSTYLKIRRFLDDSCFVSQLSSNHLPGICVCVLVLELAKSRLAVFGSWSLLRVENRWQLLLYDDTGVLINEIQKNS